MYTTIKISQELKKNLDELKVLDSETYEELIQNLIEDHLSINDATKKQIEISREEYKSGKIISFKELKKKADKNV